MKWIFVITVLFNYSVFANENEEFIEEGSTTRAIQQCEPIIATSKSNNKRVKAEKCFYGFGGIGFDPNNPPVFYYVGDKEVEEEDFLRNYTEQAQLSPEEANKYKCDGKSGDDLQCLICNCYFETGADGNTRKNISHEERVMVAKVVTSRVLNPSFANSVCGVVHERSASGRAQFSWIRLWNDNCADGTQNCKNEDASDPNHKINTVLAPPTQHDNSPKGKLIRSCTQAAKEALRDRKKYFASYYLTPGAEQDSAWAKSCREMYKTLNNRVAAGPSGNSLSHVFYKACSEDELNLADGLQQPSIPFPHPRPRPNPRTQSGTN
ncbi:MAG: cell wall hydrolase [Bdellovibrionaceae bacterium]|nr:cell wall hydrolase [Pseudobdellovibrionaceae bacterium]